MYRCTYVCRRYRTTQYIRFAILIFFKRVANSNFFYTRGSKKIAVRAAHAGTSFARTYRTYYNTYTYFMYIESMARVWRSCVIHLVFYNARNWNHGDRFDGQRLVNCTYEMSEGCILLLSMCIFVYKYACRVTGPPLERNEKSTHRLRHTPRLTRLHTRAYVDNTTNVIYVMRAPVFGFRLRKQCRGRRFRRQTNKKIKRV